MSFDNARFVLPEDPLTLRKTGGAVVLSPHYRTGTMMLWVTYFMGLLVYCVADEARSHASQRGDSGAAGSGVSRWR